MSWKIALIRGDGIGPEIVEAAVQVLDAVGARFGHNFSYTEVTAGGVSIDRFGVPLKEEELAKCQAADAVLLGAVGGPKWDELPGHLRPEKALLGVRAGLELYANIRPATLHPALDDACPLRPSIVGDGLDLVIVRELTGGIYFGERGCDSDGNRAFDTMSYSVEEIERIGRVGFETARKRRKRLTSVDKANILSTSQLWRKTMHRLRREYPDVEYSDMLVDNCAMQLVRNPGQFDVIVTENMFGDILSDEASMLTGSIGMLPSASLGAGTLGLYEPIHGSAPDIAGKGIANPIATILSAAMLMRYSLNLETEARVVEAAVTAALEAGYRTADIAEPGTKPVGTDKMLGAILENLK